MKTLAWLLASLLGMTGLVALSQQQVIPGPKPTDYKQLNRLIKARYDQKLLVTVVPGLLAGEYQKESYNIGAGHMGMVWYHWHQSVPVPSGAHALSPLDQQTYGEIEHGLNLTKIAKGEVLRVNKFYMYRNEVDLYLEPTDLRHMQDLDVNKASKQITTTSGSDGANTQIAVSGFGLAMHFYFDPNTVTKAGDYDTVVAEINKYLMPQEEAGAVLASDKNITINIGMSEDDVLKKLGEPEKTIQVGEQKYLRYKDMTIIIKDSKVLDVKVQ